MSDATRRRHDIHVELLVEAGAVMATSLDPTTTMDQVARLTIPRLADLCVIDLRDGDERDPRGRGRGIGPAAGLARWRRCAGATRWTPTASTRSRASSAAAGPSCCAQMDDMLMRSFAQGSEHARFMIEHHYRSAVVAPLLARGRTLGALSVLRLGDCRALTMSPIWTSCASSRVARRWRSTTPACSRRSAASSSASRRSS